MICRSLYPFPAVLGQEEMKNALIWNLINPRIGGVLISGQKGTAKSTLIRSLAEIGDRKLVELPLNITEDRLVGGIDFEYALKTGKKRLSPGILSQAHGQILYVDEINLLSDNLVKALAETAGEGRCRVEREGISQEYACDFILIGSMNPEESGLRPQLLDRFGLYVETKGEESPLIRCQIVKKRLAFETDPEGFRRGYLSQIRELQEKIRQARERLPQVKVTDGALTLAGKLAQDGFCQGSRGELAVIETARAICAWKGLGALNRETITEAAAYALPHRMQDPPSQPQQEPAEPEENASGEDPCEKDAPEEETKEEGNPRQQEADIPPVPEDNGKNENARQEMPPSQSQETCDSCGQTFQVGKWLDPDSRRITVRQGSGRRSLVKTDSLQGRYVKSAFRGSNSEDIALDATLRAAAPYQRSREKNGMAVAIRPEDLRTRVREKRTGNFIVFVVDASGSMGAKKRMTAVKGAILSLLNDAYQKRDRVAMITFRKNSAQLVLGMTRSVDLAAKKLTDLAVGGRTPLYAGIEMAHSLVKAAQQKEKDLLPVVVLVTDGRATCGRSAKPFQDAVEAGRAMTADHIKTLVIDAEQDFIKLKLAGKLAEEIDGELLTLSELHAGAILTAVRLGTGRI